jgi:DNA (cytosine-5)-methyltransferase 1
MRFISVCSGIEAASVAWAPLGWEPVAFSEIEPFPCAVLAHHYPNTPNWGDMTKFKDWPDATVDLLCGGTPCQSFSVAGLRKGLDDPRGNLMLTFGAIAARYRPRWLVWENVPGVLSSNGGRDFGSFLGLLGVLGYGFAYRVLDAQYFGLAQRRKRVFVVAHLGDWRRAAAVLFERHSLSGHPAPSREARQGAASTLAGGARSRGGYSTDDIPLTAGTIRSTDGGSDVDHARAAHIIQAFGGNRTSGPRDVASALSAHGGTGRHDFETETFVTFDPTQITSATNRSNPRPGDPCHTLAKGAHAPAIAFHGSQDPDVSGDVTHPVGRNHGQETCVAFQTRGSNLYIGEISGTMGTNADRASGSAPMVQAAMQVRRLTPRECERLQGFRDDYTLIPWRGKPADQCPDGPRYKALGNSWAVPKVRWIGERISAVDAILDAREAA